jgi:hypothetical protein
MITRLVCVVFALGFSSAALADMGFEAGQSVLTWSSETVKTKPNGGTESEEKTTTLSTMDDSLYLKATVDSLSFTVYPTMEDTPFAISYYVMKELEVGLNLSLDTKEVDKDGGDAKDTEESENNFGLFAVYYLEAGPGSLEIDLGFDSATTSSEEPEEGKSEKTKTEISSTKIGLGLNYVFPISKNFHYVGGLNYDMITGEISKPEPKVETNVSTLALNLASFRWVW